MDTEERTNALLEAIKLESGWKVLSFISRELLIDSVKRRVYDSLFDRLAEVKPDWTPEQRLTEVAGYAVYQGLQAELGARRKKARP